MRVYFRTGLLGAALLSAGTVAAKDKTPPPAPQAWQDMIKCRAIADSAARLACFDTQVARLEDAARKGDVVLADRETVRETKRGLFGFAVTGGGLLGDDKDGEEITELDTTITGARPLGYGLWRITLANGSVWEQTEGKLIFDPKAGNKVHLYRGALGVYRANIDGQRAVKVRRVQ